MTGQVWTPEAEQLQPNGYDGTLQTGNPVAVVHVTVSPSGGDWFDAMDQVLTDKEAEPHYLWDPITDRLGQYFPLDRSARALYNPGTLPGSPNKASSRAVIQIEIVADVDPPFTDYWQPGPNFAAMVRDITGMGVPAEWVSDQFPTSGNDPSLRLSWDQYTEGTGWVGHCHVPGNDHWDPGPINPDVFMDAVRGEADMPAKFANYYTDEDQRVSRTNWTTLAIEDDGAQSIKWGPADFWAVAHLTVQGLPAGKALKVRFVDVDVSANGNQLGHAYSATEIVGTSGGAYGTHAEMGHIGKPASGYDSRRLRIQALSDDADGVSVSALSVRLFTQ